MLLPWEGENEFGEGQYVQKRFNRMEWARPWARPPDFPCSPDLAPHDPLHDPIVRRVVTATSKFGMVANPVVINPHSMPVSP
jgi:hypothetical protein